MDKIAVLIPSLGRAKQCAEMVEQMSSVSLNIIPYVIVEEKEEDEYREALNGKAIIIPGKFGSCAKAMNAGYEHSNEPYLFTANDDLSFKPGWDKALLDKISDEKKIIGINQGDGKTTCFTLVERKYIEENSGVFDKKNTLYHKYGSQYCDTEFADYAKARGAWDEVTEPLIDHEHPTFGKGQMDATYQKNGNTLEHDMQTYQRRRKEIIDRYGSWE